eukprot:TRINITY_DN97045_c0_g1_i1.p1 TRINITY_DN97045_c0_g1~~TRINITY_DN97045_c0_g1_i1.p1  ORF type:complete len:202 (+),score=-16.82 TRINITY_DN97045_c0_g1_i1:158-763(+)
MTFKKHFRPQRLLTKQICCLVHKFHPLSISNLERQDYLELVPQTLRPVLEQYLCKYTNLLQPKIATSFVPSLLPLTPLAKGVFSVIIIQITLPSALQVSPTRCIFPQVILKPKGYKIQLQYRSLDIPRLNVVIMNRNLIKRIKFKQTKVGRLFWQISSEHVQLPWDRSCQHLPLQLNLIRNNRIGHSIKLSPIREHNQRSI